MSRIRTHTSDSIGTISVLLRVMPVSILLTAFSCASLPAQTAATTPAAAPAASVTTPDPVEDIERRLNEVTSELDDTRRALSDSQTELQKLREEVSALKTHSAENAVPSAAGTNATVAPPVPSASPASSSSTDLAALHEEQEAMQAEIKQHDQTKVESASKYPVRITGLILFNAFSNAGVVDNAELPTIALQRNPGSSHGSLGFDMRQTILGLNASGPRIWSARSSGQVSFDFFGGQTSNTFGYSVPTGIARLRQADVSLEWSKTTVDAGLIEPIFTPLSPTSYASVAQPALSASGNLWAWSPQVRVEQRVPLPAGHQFVFEGGLIDPGSYAYTSSQLVAPVEASRRPGYEGRVSFRSKDISSNSSDAFVLGVGGYSSMQFYNASTNVHSWAISGDWQVPLTHRVLITGEAYRGTSLGDFGSGAYKDILTGVDQATGLTRSKGVDVAGGWSQIKFRPASTFEMNAVFGLDDALSSNFDGLTLSSSTSPFELNARNRSFLGNIIFRPRTYLIFSPEYRHIDSWRYSGSPFTANIFTLTAGYQF